MSASAATPKSCAKCGGRYPLDALFCPLDGTPLTRRATSSGAGEDPYLGCEVAGSIDIRQLVGIGAMGRVYRAFQRGIDRDVAVKILHRELSSNQQLVTRFHREAKVASRLSHPNVVHVYLTGQLADGSMYIVMEYLDGLSLQSAMAAVGGAMPLPRALGIALQLCDAAGEGHAQGIVHRDIKPENVMLVRRGEADDFVKVLDFGIARLNWGDQSMATAAGLIFGTARYISPEGAQGEVVGPESDVYSIAILLYQMLSGRTPFEGDQAVALLIQQIHDAPPELRSIPRSAYVPEPIADVIMQNLAKSPQDREGDARLLGRALLEAAKASGLSPEDIVSRPILGTRSSSPMQIASMQRTRQLRLDSETAEKIGAAFHGNEASEPRSRPKVSEPPRSRRSLDSSRDTTVEARRTEPIGNKTTKWTPPPGFDVRLGTAPPSSDGVDPTLDEEVEPVKGVPPAPGSWPDASGRSVAPTKHQEPMAHAYASVSPGSSHRTQMLSRPPSGVDSTLSDEEALAARRRARSKAMVLVFFCFLLGVAGATGIAYKMGLIGSASRGESLESTVERANNALLAHQFDSPTGDNVRDLTTAGLKRWPNNPRLLRIRELAARDLLDRAQDRKHAGDLATALTRAKLAVELNPTDADGAALVADIERDMAEKPGALPPLTPPGVGTAAGTSARTLPSVTAPRTLDTTTARPKASQTPPPRPSVSTAVTGEPTSVPPTPSGKWL